MRIFVTHRGMRLLEQRVERLREELRSIQGQKGAATQEGSDNWHDNFAFEDLERQERMLSHALADAVRRLENARLIEPPRSTATVQVGHRVEVSLEGGAHRSLWVVGHGESDPARGWVAYDTPLGAAMIGAMAGEERSYRGGPALRSLTVQGISIDEPDGEPSMEHGDGARGGR